MFMSDVITVDIDDTQDELQTINSFIQFFTNMGAETNIRDHDGL